MRTQQHSWTALRLAQIALVVVIGTSAAYAAPRDRTPPTTPSKLRVTGVSDYSVTLTWNASTDNSGNFSYRLVSSAGVSALVPRHYTAYTFTTNHTANGTYSFYVYAQDDSNNRSPNSNTVSATLLPAGARPSAPVMTATHLGPTHITVSWSTPSDAGPPVYFFLYRDGQPILPATQQTTYTQHFLQPETTHTFTVVARDGRVRSSEHSAPLVVTTPPANPNDKTPPSAPTNLWAGGFGDGSPEFMASWSPSTDDFTTRDYIQYDVYVNDVWVGATAGMRTGITDYGVFGENTLQVFAVDESGNKSAPGTLVFTLP